MGTYFVGTLQTEATRHVLPARLQLAVCWEEEARDGTQSKGDWKVGDRAVRKVPSCSTCLFCGLGAFWILGLRSFQGCGHAWGGEQARVRPVPGVGTVVDSPWAFPGAAPEEPALSDPFPPYPLLLLFLI